MNQYLIMTAAALLFAACGEDEKETPQAVLPAVSVTGTYELHTGEPLSTLTLTGTATHEGKSVDGTFEWKDGSTAYQAAGQYDAPWVFTPADAVKYTPVEGTVAVTDLPNVYVCGSEVNSSNMSVAKVWKNDKELAPLTSGTLESSVTSLAVSGADLYVCGYEANKSSESVAKVWKNGKELYTLTGNVIGHCLVLQ